MKNLFYICVIVVILSGCYQNNQNNQNDNIDTEAINSPFTMTCTKDLATSSWDIGVTRCENNEIVCYAGGNSEGVGLQCKFKK